MSGKDLVPVERSQLEAYNKELAYYKQRVQELEASYEEIPNTNEDWLRSAGAWEKRSITYKSESTILPWVILLVGLAVAVWILKQ